MRGVEIQLSDKDREVARATQHLMRENAELNVQIDRLQREYRSLQAEMRGVVARAPGESTRASVALEDALSRVTRAERERDEAREEVSRFVFSQHLTHIIDSSCRLTSQLSRLRLQSESQHTQLNLQLDDTGRRLRSSETELQLVKEERARLAVNNEHLSARLKEALMERETAERQFQYQVSQLTATCNARVRAAALSAFDAVRCGSWSSSYRRLARHMPGQLMNCRISCRRNRAPRISGGRRRGGPLRAWSK